MEADKKEHNRIIIATRSDWTFWQAQIPINFRQISKDLTF